MKNLTVKKKTHRAMALCVMRKSGLPYRAWLQLIMNIGYGSREVQMIHLISDDDQSRISATSHFIFSRNNLYSNCFLLCILPHLFDGYIRGLSAHVTKHPIKGTWPHYMKTEAQRSFVTLETAVGKIMSPRIPVALVLYHIVFISWWSLFRYS